MRSLALVAVAALALPLTASAQDVGPRQVLSFQPLNAMLTVYSAEYERAASKAVTWGIGGTYWNVGDAGDEATYNSGDFKLRYYPAGSALYGFAIGGSVGYSSVKGESGTTSSTASGASLGVLLEYQWLMGAKKNFSLALGAGAKMLMVSEDDITASDFTARYPTARVSVGWAF